MISDEELKERVALLKRFKLLLEQQRAKFQEYLTVLEKQQDSITTENPEKLIAHTELEQQVVKSIANLQKVIVPMSRMYKNPSLADRAEDKEEIAKIQNDLNDLQNKVLEQNKINRDLLRVHITQIKTQIQNFKNPYRNNRSVYAQVHEQKIATMVQVEA